MCTDGESIIFHPDFVAKHTDEEIRLVLIHEVLHCLNRHHERRGNRDPRKWNIACDYAINPMLMDESGLSFPKDESGKLAGLYEEKFVGMRAEDIYDALEADSELEKMIKELLKKASQCGLVDDEGELSDEEILDGTVVQVAGEDEDPSEMGDPQGQPGQEGKEGQPGQPGQEGKEGKEGQPGQEGKGDKGGQQKVLPKVGETVLLNNGKEVVVRRVYPNGDIEI
jgi:hypothetical protein